MKKIFFKYDYSDFSLYNLYVSKESFGAVVFKLGFTLESPEIFLEKYQREQHGQWYF